MKKTLILLSLVITLLVAGYAVSYYQGNKNISFGATVNYQKDLVPFSNSTYSLGTTTPSTKSWKNLIVDMVCLTGDSCRTTWPTGGSGSFTDAWTIINGGLRTATSTDFAQANYFVATSTTATSTFAGDITMTHNHWLIAHGLRGDASDGLYFTANNTTPVANFGVGNSANATFNGAVNIDGNTRLATSLNGVAFLTNGTVSGVATNTLGLGTVSSVDMTVPTGLTISGNPITTSGTLALALASGYGIPLTASTTNWNNFYNTPSTRISAGNNTFWSSNTLDSRTFVSTTTAGAQGQIAYWTGASTLAPTATTTLTASGALSLSQPVAVLGSSASALTCLTASGSQAGCLSSTDWTTFNNKGQSNWITLNSALTPSTTIGTSVHASSSFSGGLSVDGNSTTTGNAYFAGNVGIGVQPSYKLDVAGFVNTDLYSGYKMG